jgi:hypothetical protein
MVLFILLTVNLEPKTVTFAIYIYIYIYGPEFDTASNRNEYQEYFLGVKAAGE